MFTVSCPPKVVWLGREGENEFRTIEVEVSEWLREYPNGTISVVYHRPDDSIYMPTVTTSGNITRWLITSTDTSFTGRGEAEFRIIDGDVIGKSVKMPTMVSDGINATTDDPDSAPADWSVEAGRLQNEIDDLDGRVTELKEDLGDLDDLETTDKSSIVAAINEAANRGGFVAQTEAPSDTNVLWIDIDDDSGGGGGSAYIAMRVSGGYIQYTTDNVTWVNLIAVADLKGAKGDKGDKGDTGAQGAQGIQGEQGIQGIQGVKGDKGDKGDAYTLTNADKQTIVTAVVDALPKYNGGVT